MFGISSTALLALTFVQLSQQYQPLNAVARPQLIVKAKAYYLHALLPATEARIPRAFRRGFRETDSSFAINGVVLLHTATATGEMKILAAGGKVEEDSLAQLNMPRKDIYQARIMGVAVDRERIYVLRWQSSSNENPSVRLLVFRPDNGAQVHSLKLKGITIPEKEPAETVKPGPLRLHADGVSCLGIRFEFQGTRLIKQRKESRP